MKAKTIRAVLRKKVDEWLATIEDEAVRVMAANNTIVTGGAIASMLLQEQVNDYDVYFRNWDTTLAVARYYASRFVRQNNAGIPCNILVTNGYNDPIGPTFRPEQYGDEASQRIKIMIKSAGIASEEGTDKPYEYFESQPSGDAQGYVADVMQVPGDITDVYEQTETLAQQTEDDGKPAYRPVFLSTNAITLSHRVQIVIRFYGEPDQIHENYDYVHCTNYWKSWDNELVLRPDALEALLTKELRYVGSKYPLCSIIRLRKFIARGWTVNAGQILKALMQISAMDLTNVATLEDQLTGVDSAYFIEVINKMKEKDPEKINAAYLIEIIDRMF
jgi:hypothetical protein